MIKPSVCLLVLLLAASPVLADEKAPTPEELEVLVRQLGNSRWKTRQAAQEKLIKAGEAALPHVRKALNDKDFEISSRARQIVALLTRSADPAKVVEDALKWLASHQTNDGWGRDVRATGLATLSFLAAGNTHRFGMYKTTVKVALRYLMKIQRADGLFRVSEAKGWKVSHAIAALTMTESYGLTKSPLVRGSATKAMQVLLTLCGKAGGGASWGDDTLAGYAVMAIASAKAADLGSRVGDAAITRALARTGSSLDRDGRSAAVRSLFSAFNPTVGDAKSRELSKSGFGALAKALPSRKKGVKPDIDGWLFGTMAHAATRGSAPKRCERWNKALVAATLPLRGEAHETSWDSDVAKTARLLMMLIALGKPKK